MRKKKKRLSKRREKKAFKKNFKKFGKEFTRNTMMNDLAATYPVDGKFLKIGSREILLTRSEKKDEDGDPIYIGTVVKRSGLSRKKVDVASHIQISRL